MHPKDALLLLENFGLRSLARSFAVTLTYSCDKLKEAMECRCGPLDLFLRAHSERCAFISPKRVQRNTLSHKVLSTSDSKRLILVISAITLHSFSQH